MKTRLTERDLTRIVRRVINESKKEELVSEQTLWGLAKIGARAATVGKQTADRIGLVKDIVDALNSAAGQHFERGMKIDEQKSLSNLFYWGTKNNGPSDVDYKTKINTLYNAMQGGGTWEDDVEEVMGSLKNMNQLSKLIHNWKSITGSDESLYDWLVGDMWEKEVWDAIGSWKDKYAVYTDQLYIAKDKI